jgi:NAD(P)H dehydrogenase (quinone)
VKVLIPIYSMYGHIYKMAQAVKEGVEKVEGMEGVIMRVPETLPEDVIEKMGASEAKEEIDKLPVVTPEDLADADAIIFGTPTRFGNMIGQMRQFLDSTGGLWAEGKLVGKVGGVFTSSATQHGGQESTILTFHVTMLHQGMIIAGLPYAFEGQTTMDEITGGSPYGAATIADGDGSRMPTENELNGARHQGKYIAGIAKKLNS